MEALAFYLLKSVIWLAGFAIVYLLFLSNERFFRLKRYYLLAGILISLVFPFITFHYQVNLPEPQNIEGLIPSGPLIAQAVQPVVIDSQFDYRFILLIIYLTGIFFFVLRIINHVIGLTTAIKKSKITGTDNSRIIRNSGFRGSFSFFNYVFVNPSLNAKELEIIVNHELVHVNQKHWIDLLLIELLCIVQWVNPFAWVYSGLMKQNHEYIADEVALLKTPDPGFYKAVLVNQLFGSEVISLSNSFKYSLNKKRFEMMKKISVSPFRKMKILFVLPLFAIVFFAFSQPEYNYIISGGTSSEQVITQEADQLEARGTVVNENGEPLQGVRVIVTKSLIGATTDSRGRFFIGNIPNGSSLLFSYSGYKTYTLPPLISSNSALRIVLVEDPDYDDQSTVLIRDSSGSETKPLIVVDGKISDIPIEQLDPKSIHSIDVLKDEPAINKYGEKGENGVIEIITKANVSSVTATEASNLDVSQKTVKGIVVNEEGQPLEGVEVMSTGTMGKAYHTTTLKDGRFEIKDLGPEVSLLFFCRGYKSVTIKADFSNEMSIKLEKDPEYKAPAVQRYEPLVVIDGVITDKSFIDARKELGYDLGPVELLSPDKAKEKYGDKAAMGVYEITTRKKALEKGIKSPLAKLAPEDFPTFQGYKASVFNDWAAKQIKYPAEAKAGKKEGWVTVNYTVELDGSISNIVPAGQADPLLTEEVIRVIRSSPKWDPPKNPEVDSPFSTSFTTGFKLPDQVITSPPYVVVEEMPQYPGGEMEILKFIAMNMQYPDSAKAEGIEGRVIVRFIVNTEGNAEGISVIKGIHPLLDAEAMRVVSKLSGFKPGMQGGKPVNVWYMVPISFTLNK